MIFTQPRSVQYAKALYVAAGFIGTEKLHLFKSTFTPGPNSVTADFDANEVAFTGYSDVTIATPWVAGLALDGSASAIYGSLASFIQTGVALTDIAGGWYITNVANDLVLCGVFDTPVNFDLDGTTLLVKPNLDFLLTSDADAEVVTGP